jgi:hypothetical protein
MIDILVAAYRDCGEVEHSISAAKESIRLKPQKDEAQLILCSDYELTDNHVLARRSAEKIIANNPTFRLADYARSQPY